MRHGDKGFRSAGAGFCTHPSGQAMRRTFEAIGDMQTAAGFGWSSMESACDRARRHGAMRPLCAVSEMPLFIVPGSATNSVRPQLAACMEQPDPSAALQQWLAATGGYALSLSAQTQVMRGLVYALAEHALQRTRHS